MLKKLRGSMIWSSVLCMIMGAVILIFPQITALAVCYMFGAALAIYGVVKIVGYFSSVDMGYMFRFDLMMGIVYALAGVLLIMHPGAIMAAMPVLLGIVLAAGGIARLQLALDIRRMGYSRWWATMAASVLEIVLAVMIMLNPFEGGQALFMFIGASYIVDGAVNLYTILRVSNAIKDIKRIYG